MPSLFDKPIVSPILVGRTAELSLLHQFTNQAKNGQGQAIFISGEAGIGKSRLLKDAVIYASAHSFQVFQGNCFQPDYACPYAPILDLFQDRITDSVVFPSVLPFTSDLSQLLSGLLPPDSMPALPLDPEQEKRRLFAGLTQFFMQEASRHPILLVIEDIHWSDATSLDFVHYLPRFRTNEKK